MKLIKEILSSGKRLFISGVVATSLLATGVSCNMPDVYNCEGWYEIDDSSVPKDVDTPKEINDWVKNNSNIRYVRDKRNNDREEYWQLPQETLKKGRGDCEDRALLGLALYYKRRGNVGSLELGKLNGEGHAEANYHGKVFESKFKKETTIPWQNISYEMYFRRNH